MRGTSQGRKEGKKGPGSKGGGQDRKRRAGWCQGEKGKEDAREVRRGSRREGNGRKGPGTE